MTDTLISILLTGGAVTYFIEFLLIILQGFFTDKSIYTALVLPLSSLCLWILDIVGRENLVYVPASAFVVLFFYRFVIHTPVKVQTINKTNTLDSRRLGL